MAGFWGALCLFRISSGAAGQLVVIDAMDARFDGNSNRNGKINPPRNGKCTSVFRTFEKPERTVSAWR